LFLITYVYHDARFKKTKAMEKLMVAFRNFANTPKSDSKRVQRCVNSSCDPRFKVTMVDRPLFMPDAQEPYRHKHSVFRSRSYVSFCGRVLPVFVLHSAADTLLSKY